MSTKYNFNKSRLLLSAVMVILFFSAASLPASDDVIINAFSDEISRSLTDLKLEDNVPPYYMGYIVNLEDNYRIYASNGSIIICSHEPANQAFLDLRVGSYEFDNSNLLTGFRGLGMATLNLPRELEYTSLRKTAWLVNDQSYKRTVELLAQKKAILQSLIPDDTIPDLTPGEKVISLNKIHNYAVDTTMWKKRLIKLSAMFNAYPQFKISSLQLFTKAENRYIINSEGTRIRTGREVHYLLIEARAMDKNGLPVYQYDRIIVANIDDFPSEKELEKWVENFISEAVKMVDAEILDDYIGPVLFSQNASVQLFSALFLNNISNPRKPLTADNRFDQYLSSAKLIRKIGFRVLPDFMNVFDDPTIEKYKGMKLFGSYEYDDQGVPAQKITLAEKGKLRNYYMSRTPTIKFRQSNGHGRLAQSGLGAVEAVGKPANVIIEADDSYSFDELKNQMIELCQSMDIEYGLIIDNMNFSGQPESDEVINFMGRSNQGSLPNVLNGYLVSVKDGSLTPVRSLEFINVSERSLKDILAVGDDFKASTLMFDRSFNNLSSLVISSLLIEEMELKKVSFPSRKAPIAQNPLGRK